jgi:hypothetical protein
VANTVQERVAQYAYPALYQQPGGNFVQGWDFRNLLGAMWLQMFFLLCSDRERWCKNPECNNIIAFEQPEQVNQGNERNDLSAGYAPNKKRVFCDRKCRNHYNYLEKVKPRRQAAGTR